MKKNLLTIGTIVISIIASAGIAVSAQAQDTTIYNFETVTQMVNQPPQAVIMTISE